MTLVRPPPLTDGVVRLRDWCDDDAEWYAVSIDDPEIQRFTSEPETLTAAEVQAGISDLHQREDAAGFVVCAAADGERWGNIAISHDGSSADLSYWLAATARGHGAATRAVRLVCTWAAETFAVREIRLWTHADNAASQRVAVRAGFRHEPARDGERTVRGRPWPTTAYVLTLPAADGE